MKESVIFWVACLEGLGREDFEIGGEVLREFRSFLTMGSTEKVEMLRKKGEGDGIIFRAFQALEPLFRTRGQVLL